MKWVSALSQSPIFKGKVLGVVFIYVVNLLCYVVLSMELVLWLFLY